MFLSALLTDVVWYPFLFDTPFSALRAVAFWLTVLSVIAYMVCLFLQKTEKRSKFIRQSLPYGIAYIGGLCALALLLGFLEDGWEPLLFFPLLILLLSLCAWGMAYLLSTNKKLQKGLLLLCILSLLGALVCVGIHFMFGDAAENNWLTKTDVQSLALYVSSLLSVGLLFLLTHVLGKGENLEFDAKSITTGAICIAMSFALSYLRIVRLPQGGSITPASLLPLMLYAYLFGCKKGVFIGFTYGILQALQDPTLLHPAQFLLDYPVAFAWIGLAGAFAKWKKCPPALRFALGGLVAGLGRFAMHWLSGAFAFGVFAPEGTPALLYSFLYQAGYVLPDLVIVLVAGCGLYLSKSFQKELTRFQR